MDIKLAKFYVKQIRHFYSEGALFFGIMILSLLPFLGVFAKTIIALMAWGGMLVLRGDDFEAIPRARKFLKKYAAHYSRKLRSSKSSK